MTYNENSKFEIWNCSSVSNEIIDCLNDMDENNIKSNILDKRIVFSKAKVESNQSMCGRIDERVAKIAITAQNSLNKNEAKDTSKDAFKNNGRQILQSDVDEMFLKSVAPLISIGVSNEAKFDREFIRLRRFVFGMCKKNFPKIYGQKEMKECNEFEYGSWNCVDEFVFEIVMRVMETKETWNAVKDTFDISIKMYSDLLTNASKIIKTKFNNFKVIPNQRGKFKAVGEVYEDLGVPEEFGSIDFVNFGVDTKEVLLDKECTFDVGKTQSVNDYSVKIDALINGRSMSDKNVFVVVNKVVLMRPKNDELYTNKIRSVNQIAQKLRGNCQLTKIDVLDTKLWENATTKYIENICTNLGNGFNMRTFDAKLGPMRNEDEKFDLLKDVLKLSYKTRNAQGINLNGDSMTLTQLSYVDDEKAETFVVFQDKMCLLDVNKSCCYKSEKQNILDKRVFFDELLTENKVKVMSKKCICGKIDEMIMAFYSRNLESCKTDEKLKKILTLIFSTEEFQSEDMFTKSFNMKREIVFNVIQNDEMREMMFQFTTLSEQNELDAQTVFDRMNNYKDLQHTIDILNAKLEKANENLKQHKENNENGIDFNQVHILQNRINQLEKTIASQKNEFDEKIKRMEEINEEKDRQIQQLIEQLSKLSK
ncbi:hypothetical protein EIN_201560 [Entamoeba invadens IP1]|uniref:Uncharacterized protein n=1 Tax=Entamoeba invadens IP1 TaxID=370355 RepID=A0A0A1U5U7_ENTIV|nr:hypothetical protein EIN_201560 [Entamoeba invadens IP1]ELP89631.1 hypothetical protein EIN_201560 [Entamoeba invadens IP1]|eukprot:XP_004256402.1 hypothetical protein EIN_201560 [Entamoeba invadens IP1]